MELKIMTFNLRVDTKGDGINYWKYRTDLVKAAIKDESPDLIGFQEVTRVIFEDVREMISDEYVIVGAGREADFTGEGVNIAFKKDKFDLLSLETFWLSDTPTVPGSRYENLDQSIYPRVAIISGLALRGLGKMIYFCNTHLDHTGKQAQLAGAKLVLEKLSRVCTEKDKIIITGDMNARPESPVIPELCNKALGISELTQSVKSTFHKYGIRAAENVKIDYIFTNAEKSSKEPYAVTKYQKDGVYCSDHYPVCGFIEI